MVWFQLNQQQKDAVLELERTKSQRITAVVGGALLDQSLEVALTLRLRADDDAIRKVFKPSGPMGGANKVDLAYLLYIFDKPTRDAFAAIFTIRNLFAHNLDMTFETKKYPDMTKALSKLTLHVGRKLYPDHIVQEDSHFRIGKTDTNKSKFIANLKIALLLLGKDHSTHLPWQNTPSNVTYSRAPSPSPSRDKRAPRKSARLQKTNP